LTERDLHRVIQILGGMREAGRKRVRQSREIARLITRRGGGKRHPRHARRHLGDFCWTVIACERAPSRGALWTALLGITSRRGPIFDNATRVEARRPVQMFGVLIGLPSPVGSRYSTNLARDERQHMTRSLGNPYPRGALLETHASPSFLLLFFASRSVSFVPLLCTRRGRWKEHHGVRRSTSRLSSSTYASLTVRANC